MNATQFLIGVSGALVGGIGWLVVGLFIQKRAQYAGSEYVRMIEAADAAERVGG